MTLLLKFVLGAIFVAVCVWIICVVFGLIYVVAMGFFQRKEIRAALRKDRP